MSLDQQARSFAEDESTRWLLKRVGVAFACATVALIALHLLG